MNDPCENLPYPPGPRLTLPGVLIGAYVSCALATFAHLIFA